MTTTEHHLVEGFFAFLIVCLLVTVYYTDRRFSRERTRNADLVTKIHNLQTLSRIQDKLLVAKIDVILEEHHADEHPELHPPGPLTVDEAIMRLEYCYDCFGLRGPGHFKLTGHRATPAPELTDSSNA